MVNQHDLAKQKRQNKANIEDFNGLTAQQIQNNLSKIKNQNANLEGVLAGSPSAPLLADIVRAIPDQIWINKITYKEEFPPKKTNARSLVLEGFIQTDRDTDLGTSFRDQLAKTPSIKALCGNKGDMQFKFVESQGEGRTRGSGKGTETSFTYTCEKGGASK